MEFSNTVYGVVAVWAILLWIILEIALTFVSMSVAPFDDDITAVLADPEAERVVKIFVRFLERLMGTIGVALALLVYGPLRRGAAWAEPVAIVLSLGMLIPQLITWLSLGNPPVAIALVSTLLTLVLVSAFRWLRNR